MVNLTGISFIFLSLIFLSCNSTTSQSRDVVKPDIKLTTDLSLDSAQRIGWKEFYVRLHKKNGENYTGKQTYYYQENIEKKTPYLIRSFKNGLLQKEIAFREDGKEIGHTEYVHVDKKIVKVTSFYANGRKKSEALHYSFTEDSLGMIKEWHKNGQLKFQVKIDKNNNYTGQVTLKNEDGKIVMQEEY